MLELYIDVGFYCVVSVLVWCGVEILCMFPILSVGHCVCVCVYVCVYVSVDVMQ